jgi:subtilisin family serine protease
VDIFAPGDGILSAWGESDTSYATLSGTSMGEYLCNLTTYMFRRRVPPDRPLRDLAVAVRPAISF